MTSEGICMARRIPAAPRPSEAATRNVCAWLEMENNKMLPTSQRLYVQFSFKAERQEIDGCVVDEVFNIPRSQMSMIEENRLPAPNRAKDVKDPSHENCFSTSNPTAT